MAKALCVLQSELANGLIAKKCENLAEDKPSTKRGLKRKKGTQKQSNKFNNSQENCSDSQLLKGEDRPLGNFPSAKEVASLDQDFLKSHCNLGYRAENIVKLAKHVVSGKLKIEEFEEAFESSPSYEIIYKEMMKIKGFGPFACSSVMMCMGFYQVIPMDSETIRHLEDVHGRKVPKVCMRKKLEAVQQYVKDIYDKYAPFQSLAYWYIYVSSSPYYYYYLIFSLILNFDFSAKSFLIFFLFFIIRFELLEYYEEKFGKLSELPNSSYHVVTSSH